MVGGAGGVQQSVSLMPMCPKDNVSTEFTLVHRQGQWETQADRSVCVWGGGCGRAKTISFLLLLLYVRKFQQVIQANRKTPTVSNKFIVVLLLNDHMVHSLCTMWSFSNMWSRQCQNVTIFHFQK